jgi:hypothetical protein
MNITFDEVTQCSELNESNYIVESKIRNKHSQSRSIERVKPKEGVRRAIQRLR